LAFKADITEPLRMDDLFRIDTPTGSYIMTKRDFYEASPLIPVSKSYLKDRLYSYREAPKRAEQFLVLPQAV
jgi:hypothetical protein